MSQEKLAHTSNDEVTVVRDQCEPGRLGPPTSLRGRCLLLLGLDSWKSAATSITGSAKLMDSRDD